MKESGGSIMGKLKPVIGHFTGKITPEMWAQFEEASKRPIVFDEEMPELTEEDMARFHPVYKRSKKAEKRVGLVLESAAAERLRESGRDWQTRLRAYVEKGIASGAV
jgi:uncharacterized protein (DUF4415 family)